MSLFKKRDGELKDEERNENKEEKDEEGEKDLEAPLDHKEDFFLSLAVQKDMEETFERELREMVNRGDVNASYESLVTRYKEWPVHLYNLMDLGGISSFDVLLDNAKRYFKVGDQYIDNSGYTKTVSKNDVNKDTPYIKESMNRDNMHCVIPDGDFVRHIIRRDLVPFFMKISLEKVFSVCV